MIAAVSILPPAHGRFGRLRNITPPEEIWRQAQGGAQGGAGALRIRPRPQEIWREAPSPRIRGQVGQDPARNRKPAALQTPAVGAVAGVLPLTPPKVTTGFETLIQDAPRPYAGPAWHQLLSYAYRRAGAQPFLLNAQPAYLRILV